MSATLETQRSAKPGNTWRIACALSCVAVFAYAFYGRNHALGEGVPYQMGYNLPIAAILSGALHLFFRKRESSQTGWLGFALIYASLIAAASIAESRQKSELRTVATEMQNSISAIDISASSSQSTPIPPPITSSATGEAGKIDVLLKTVLNRAISQRREYMLELEAIGWPNILDGSRLKNDSTFAQSRTMVQQAKDIVAKYRSRTDTLYAQMRRDIETSGMGTELRRATLAVFDQRLSQGISQAAELWSLEEQVIGHIENGLNLLAARHGGWTLQEGQVTFHRQKDLDLFNAHLKKAEVIASQQEQMQAASLQKAKEGMSQLGK